MTDIFSLTPPEPEEPIVRRQYRSGANRRQEIMEAVVKLLSERKQEKFTTKEIASSVGVSEACLYRHFKNKAEILSGIADFCDSAVSAMCSEIDAKSGLSMRERAIAKMQVLLSFAEANPGLTRLLTGEALVYEDAAVAERILRIIAKAETSMRQSLKLAIIEREIAADTNISMHANLMMSFVEGRWRRFSQSGFTAKPTEGWSAAKRLFLHIG